MGDGIDMGVGFIGAGVGRGLGLVSAFRPV